MTQGLLQICDSFNKKRLMCDQRKVMMRASCCIKYQMTEKGPVKLDPCKEKTSDVTRKYLPIT